MTEAAHKPSMRVRLKNRFGRRYMSANEFLEYAQDLDVLIDHPPSQLLEFTEKHGILKPVARLRFPPEIVRRWHKDRCPQPNIPYQVEGDGPRLQHATELRHEIYNNLWTKTDVYGERKHLLDEIAAEHAPFVQTIFDKDSFVPWTEFRTVIAIDDGREIYEGGNSVRSCYHYWQVFALAAFLRSGARILYDLSDEELFHDIWAMKFQDRSREKVQVLINLEAHHELSAIKKRRVMFDAVAYFEAYRHNALQKHIHNLDRKTGRLSVTLSREYHRREREIAREALQRSKLKPGQVLAFIKFQCDLWHSATRRGPAKVADEYRSNIHSTIDLYRLVSRAPIEAIITKVGRRGGSFKPILKVIFPDWLEEQRDLAERSLKSWMIPSMTNLPPPFSISDQDIVDFCDWIEENSLLQFYWHFKRLLDIGRSDDAISRSATAAKPWDSPIQLNYS